MSHAQPQVTPPPSTVGIKVPSPSPSPEPSPTSQTSTTRDVGPTPSTPQGPLYASHSASATSSPGVPSPIVEQPKPGMAKNPHPPGTNNCLAWPRCKDSEECYVLSDGLVCLDRELNWGYILARNESGIASVPSWRGQRSGLGANCSYMHVPDNTDLAQTVYDLVQGTIPPDLLISDLDKVTSGWYTLFSNCDEKLACHQGTCQLRPQLGQPCFSSWQCNPQALGLNENNYPISTANATQVRCEYKDGFKSVNQTCQLLYRNPALNGDDGGEGAFSVWRVILPVIALLVLIYFGAVLYQRRKRQEKLRKWSRRVEEGNDFHMETYEEVR
ncbi:hypothetical protein BGZ94_010186 [Podila epigama]|nr:hypothetical protein BGZ94_010186 [Podila epigama]